MLRTYAAALLVACLCAPALAQKYPTKPIRLVVPFPPGGSSDVVARIVADGARDVLGQTLVIENVGGAGGNIGTARAKNSPPDGYTVIECTIGTDESFSPVQFQQQGVSTLSIWRMNLNSDTSTRGRRRCLQL